MGHTDDDTIRVAAAFGDVAGIAIDRVIAKKHATTYLTARQHLVELQANRCVDRMMCCALLRGTGLLPAIHSQGFEALMMP